MFRLVSLIALAGCGRWGFGTNDGTNDAARGDVLDVLVDVASDVPTDVVPLGHDEDGDGVPDVDDNCPHLVAAQTDTDGDGVGDACDPNPTVAGETIVRFATMAAGDQPFVIGMHDGVWTQLPDALRFDGDPLSGGDNNLFAHLDYDVPLANVQITLGFDITQLIENTDYMQKQFALAVDAPAPLHYVELNEVDGLFSRAVITYFDGTNYTAMDFDDLATGVHTGSVRFQMRGVVGSQVRLDAGWPGEMYAAQMLDNVYQGGSGIDININNLHLEIRYLIVISSP